jgi:hypothetical protein
MTIDACTQMKRHITNNMPTTEDAKNRGIVFIYALVDPRTDEIRYIGKTNNLLVRYTHHVGPAANVSCTSWVRELIALGLAPDIQIISEPDISTWEEVERDTIEKYSKITRLLNISSGGDGDKGGRGCYPSTIEKLRVANIGRKMTPEARKKMSDAKRGAGTYNYGKHLTETHKQHLKESQTGEKSIMSKPVLQFTKDKQFVKWWGSALEASSAVGVVRHAVHMCAEGFNKTSAGFIWVYESDLIGETSK